MDPFFNLLIENASCLVRQLKEKETNANLQQFNPQPIVLWIIPSPAN
jgi:hypothetical protein